MPLPVIPNCDNCGLCCQHTNVPPFSYEDGDAPPAELQLEIDAYRASPRYTGAYWPCLWLNRVTGKCLHYEHRPRHCRQFELGGRECRQYRAHAGLDAPNEPRP